MTNDIKNMKNLIQEKSPWVVGHWVIGSLRLFTLHFAGEPFPAQYNNKYIYNYIGTFFTPTFFMFYKNDKKP